MYYDYNDILSRNGVYNFIVGGRGIGKSYGAKLRIVSRAIKHGEEFIFVRRYDPELKTTMSTFFKDIDHNFPDHVFKVEGGKAWVAKKPVGKAKPVYKAIGVFVALSQAHTLKSGSFPNVKTIVFDEFINEKGRRYLTNEYNIFNGLYNSVDRFQDRVRALFLANSVSIMNDYFIALDIEPDKGKEWHRLHNGFVVCHFPDAAEFRTQAMSSRFGRFIEGTEYGDFALGNEFKDGNKTLIGKKPDTAQYWFTLDTRRGVFSVWQDMNSGELFVLARRPGREDVYTLDVSRVTETRRLMHSRDGRLTYLKQMFTRAHVKFDKAASRNAFLEIMK